MFVYMTVTRYTFQNGSISGYLMGDGTGVGKGGIIAGLIMENWLNCKAELRRSFMCFIVQVDSFFFFFSISIMCRLISSASVLETDAV
jgi:hypothetical protein